MRIIVAGMHIALGLLVIGEGLVVVLQSRLNLLWEMGFYGERSPVSLVLGGASLVVIGMGLATLLGGALYARTRAGGRWVLLNSLLLICIGVPEAIAWVLVAGSALVVIDQTQTLRAERIGDDGDDGRDG